MAEKKRNTRFLKSTIAAALVLILCFSSSALALSFDTVSRVELSETPEGLKVAFISGEPIRHGDIDVRNEAKGSVIICDLLNIQIEKIAGVIQVQKHGINVIQVSKIKDNPKVSRAVFVLTQAVDYKVFKGLNEIYFTFYNKIRDDAGNVNLGGAKPPVNNPVKKYNDILTDDAIKHEFHFDNMPVEEVVKKFAAKTKMNVVIKNTVSGKITAHVQGNLYELLEGIFKFNGFNYTVDETSIAITGRNNTEEMEVELKFKELTFREISETISEMANINVVIDKGIPIDQKVSFYVHKMKLLDALKLLAKMYDYIVVKIDDGTYVITAKSNENAYEKKIKKVFSFKNSDPNDIITLINKSHDLKSIFRTANFSIDTRTNSLLVFDTPKNIKTLEDLIVKIDRGVRQVDIEVKLVEVQRDGLSRLGIKTATAIGFSDITKKLKVENINATMEFLENQNKAKVLASPRLLVVNNKTASTLIGEEIPVPYYDYVMASNGATYFPTNNSVYTQSNNNTSGYGGSTNSNNNTSVLNPLSYLQSTSSTNQAQNVISNVAYLPIKRYKMEDIGIKLNIKPQIHSDTEVTIDLNMDVSSLLSVTEDGQIHRGTRKTNTTVRLKDNNTAVFGGIIKQEERNSTIKVPLLGDIPRLGRLFSHVTKTRVDTELIMLITPHITPFDMPRRDEKDDGINELISSSFQY
jgi:type II secretory pathway component GspD/PulD (secretin)